MKQFRLLRPEEIECRVARVTEKGVVLLLYKTARTDADILDETVGHLNWQNGFEVIDGTLYGYTEIWDAEKKQWIHKTDAGTESNTEAEKGRASDAFKRAGFKWGIGRELYSAPFTFVPAGKCKITNGKCYDEFEVAAIDYDDKERICYLVITVKGAVVFEWGEPIHQDPNVFLCENCGRQILDGRKRNGEKWTAKDIATYTKLTYGKSLCSICATEAKNAGEAN